MAGNHLKRCALMRWSFSILNDHTKCLVWSVNSRNTEAKKARPKIMFSFKNGWEPSQKTRLDALIIFHIGWQHQVSSLVGKQSKYWSKADKTENHVSFLRMAGNYLKRRALMRWSFFILNDNTKYLVRWVNNRNTEAKKARPKTMCF